MYPTLIQEVKVVYGYGKIFQKQNRLRILKKKKKENRVISAAKYTNFSALWINFYKLFIHQIGAL